MDGFRALPSVDQFLNGAEGSPLVLRYGRAATREAVRARLDELRDAIRAGENGAILARRVAGLVAQDLSARDSTRLRPTLNLSGTILHTQLGRSVLADEAIRAAAIAMANPMALELDLDSGTRGARDDHLRALLCELTGAEDVTFVNNNAAAVFLATNTFAMGRRALVSRGELIDIGGGFRLPEVIARAGATLVEVGTTNRTHPQDYQDALSAETGLLLKVEMSNYHIAGYTAETSPAQLAQIAREARVPLYHDLGAGSLVDLGAYGLAREGTVAEALRAGADLVSFSGDKLLGGPQAGFLAGRRDLIAALNKNPLKRALRLDKIRIAALEATLRLYRDPDRLAERLPTLRLIARPVEEIHAQALRLAPRIEAQLSPLGFTVEPCLCESQIGAGARPMERLASAGLRISGASGRAPERLAARLRALPVPILGYIREGALILDLRCLVDDAALTQAMAAL